MTHDKTFLLLLAACSAVAACVTWVLTRRWYLVRLQQLQLRYDRLYEAGVKFAQQTRQQISSLRAELAAKRALLRATSEARAQRARAAELEAMLMAREPKQQAGDEAFADTQPFD